MYHHGPQWAYPAEVLEPVLDRLPIGVALVDEQGRFTYFNREAERLLATGPQDVPAEAWADVYGCFLPDRVTPFPADRMPLVRALAGEEVSGELMFVRNPRQAEGVWIRISARPLPLQPGQAQAAVAVFADVTAQRRALEEVELLSRAVEHTADSVIIANRSGVITYVNPALERTTGYSREEVLGQTPRILKSGLHDKAFYEAMWRGLLAGQPFRGTLQNRKKNGELYWAEQTITPILGDKGEITHFVSVLKDITASRRHQEQEIRMGFAREVQQRLYARTAAVPGLDVGVLVRPADQTGGDYVDFIPVPDVSQDAVVVAVGDVVGHGIDAALLMACTRSYVRSFCQLGLGVGKVLSDTNRMLLADLDGKRFVTLVLAHFDFQQNVLSYASAGHVPGFVLSESGTVEATLDSTGVPLGILDGQAWDTRSLPVETGQIVLLLTDGVTEAGELEEYGMERATEYVRRRRTQPAQQIADGLHDDIQAFTGGRPAEDDVSIVILKVK